MRFTDPLTALEFFINHRLGGGEPVSHDAIVTACDLERILDRFPAPLQRSLFDFAWHGIENQFTKRTLRIFGRALADAGYMTPNPSVQMLVAA